MTDEWREIPVQEFVDDCLAFGRQLAVFLTEHGGAEGLRGFANVVNKVTAKHRDSMEALRLDGAALVARVLADALDQLEAATPELMAGRPGAQASFDQFDAYVKEHGEVPDA